MSMYDPTTALGLRIIVRDHEAINHHEFLTTLILQIPPSLRGSPEAKFLCSVELFHQQRISAEHDWGLVLRAFQDIGEQPGILGFYLWYYRAMSASNWQGIKGLFPNLLKGAIAAAENGLGIPEVHLAVGLVRGMNAECLWNPETYQGNRDHAFTMFCHAMWHRIAWFKHVETHHESYDPMALEWAAIRIVRLWKLCKAWQTEKNLFACWGVNDAWMSEVRSVAKDN